MQDKNGVKTKWATKRAIVSLTVVVLVILAAVLYLVLHKAPNQFKYSQLNNYTLGSAVEGAGLSFQKPVQDKVLSSNRGSVSLYHALPNTRLASFFSAGIVAYPQGVPSTDISQYTPVLSQPSNQYYARTVASIKQFAQTSLPKGATMSFGNAQKLTNANISSGAWLFEYKGSNPKAVTKNYTGDAVFAIGKKGYYFLSFYAPDANWGNNKATWQSVIDSVKIDQ